MTNLSASLGSLFLVALLSGCGTTGMTKLQGTTDQANSVQVSEVINSIKCGVGTFLVEAHNTPLTNLTVDRFPVETVQAVLTLRDVNLSLNNQEAALVVPVAGFTFGPSASVSQTLTDTNTSVFTLSFSDLKLDKNNIIQKTTDVAKICASKNGGGSFLNKGGNHPISETLKSYRASMDKVKGGFPKIKSDMLMVTSQLDISTSKAAGFELGFSVVSAENSKTTTQSSRQILSLTFGTPNAVPAK